MGGLTRKHGYRPDIDGLRALAVTSILLFHVDPNWMPGGFVGVDMFFVISGYLITSIIKSRIADQTFSFREFYRRRILRILPAATLVICATLVVGQLVMPPTDFRSLASAATAAQMWAANVYFTYYLETGYFAPASVFQPLLHLWSLGVEEQFYLVFPAALVFTLYRGRSGIFWALAAIAIVVSFAIGQWLAANDASFAYYMLPSRAGQFLVGALVCAVLNGRSGRMGAGIGTLLSIAGLGLLAWSLLALSEGSLYPGLNAAPVTLGTALLILGGGVAGNVASIALSWPVIRSVGLVSYSLYLWHWPVISYWWYLFGPPDALAKCCLLSGSVALAAMTYYAIEKPFRALPIGFSAAALRLAVVPFAVSGVILGSIYATNGLGAFAFSKSYQEKLAAIEKGQGPAYAAPYVCQSTALYPDLLKNPRCIINGPETDDRILLWGDSNAAHYVGAMKEAAEEFGFAFRNIAHASCPPVLNAPERFVLDTMKSNCAKSAALVRKQLPNYRTLVVSASWDAYNRENSFFPALEETLATLVKSGHRVFVVGRVPRMEQFDRHCEAKRLKLSFLQCDKRSLANPRKDERVNAVIRAIASRSGATYFDFNAAICDRDQCRGYIDGANIYYDAGHWSIAGSIAVGKRLRERGQMPAALRPLGRNDAGPHLSSAAPASR